MTSQIRLVYGISYERARGLSFFIEDHFEAATGHSPMPGRVQSPKVHQLDVWVGDNDFTKVRFVDEGESCIIWTVEYVPEQRGFLGNCAYYTRTVKEIRLRRDIQMPAA